VAWAFNGARSDRLLIESPVQVGPQSPTDLHQLCCAPLTPYITNQCYSLIFTAFAGQGSKIDGQLVTELQQFATIQMDNEHARQPIPGLGRQLAI
jgi:hypothetical protein